MIIINYNSLYYIYTLCKPHIFQLFPIQIPRIDAQVLDSFALAKAGKLGADQARSAEMPGGWSYVTYVFRNWFQWWLEQVNIQKAIENCYL